jgi:hypothetical protein
MATLMCYFLFYGDKIIQGKATLLVHPTSHVTQHEKMILPTL